MKRLWMIVQWCLLSLTAPALAQVESAEELNRLEDLRYQSMMDADVKTMNELFADDFVYQTLQGVTHSKASYVKVFTTGDVKINSVRRENTRVKFYADTATVMANAHLNVSFKGQARDLSLFYLNVWVKRDGRWQLVARQSTELPKK